MHKRHVGKTLNCTCVYQAWSDIINVAILEYNNYNEQKNY